MTLLARNCADCSQKTLLFHYCLAERLMKMMTYIRMITGCSQIVYPCLFSWNPTNDICWLFSWSGYFMTAYKPLILDTTKWHTVQRIVKLEDMWKTVVLASFKVYSSIFWKITDENHEKLPLGHTFLSWYLNQIPVKCKSHSLPTESSCI
jgi:hypothetical protein